MSNKAEFTQQQLENISQAKIVSIQRLPFFGVLLLHTRIVATNTVPTAGVCSRGVMWVNPDFIEKLTVGELVFLLCHEVLHLALSHVTRLNGRNHRLHNIACDLWINDTLIDSKVGTFIECGIDPREYDWKKYLKDGETYRDLDTEEIYDRLIESLPPEDAQSGCMGNKLEQESQDRAGEASAVDWNNKLQEAAQTVEMNNNHGGSVPANISRLLKSLLEPTVNWKQLLAQYVSMCNDADYNTFDRRFLCDDLYWEDLESDQLKINVFIDTSGSISGNDIQNFFSELSGIVRCVDRAAVDVYTFDSVTYDAGTLDNSFDYTSLKIAGGGGSALDHRALEIIDGSYNDKSMSVVITDAYIDWNQLESRSAEKPVLVLCSDKYGMERVPSHLEKVLLTR